MPIESTDKPSSKGESDKPRKGVGGGRIKGVPRADEKKGAGPSGKWWNETIRNGVIVGCILLVLGSVFAIPKEWAIHTFWPSANTNPSKIETQQVKDQEPKPDTLKHSNEADEGKTISHIITFDSRDTQNKVVSFGNCPDENCYIIERGERASFGKVEGQIIHLFGTGFATSEYTMDGKLSESRMRSMVRNGIWGIHLLYGDGSNEYSWIKLDGPVDDTPLKKPVKSIKTAVWIPLEKNKRVDISTLRQDIGFTVIDDSINHWQVRMEVSSGTYCKKEGLDSKACEEKYANN